MLRSIGEALMKGLTFRFFLAIFDTKVRFSLEGTLIWKVKTMKIE